MLDLRRADLEKTAAVIGTLAAVGMFVVLVMGSTVTSTGSAQGCGRDWPLCRGQLIPQFAVNTFIEFSHRAVTAIESVLILALAALALLLWRQRRAVLVLVGLMVGALFLQAGMGAAAVKWPEQPVVLALHFGISLIALATTVLTAIYVRRPKRQPVADSIEPGLRWAVWGTAAYVYVLVYSGAYIRHTGAAAACTSWPGCTSGVRMGTLPVLLDWAHRSAAVLVLVVAVGLLLGARRAIPRQNDLVRGASWLVAAICAQGVAGAILVMSHFDLFGELLHAALTGVVFTLAAYLCFVCTVGRSGGRQLLPGLLTASPETAAE
ncbi:MAG TPA: COX15/CtaA family protein [Candidatus Acidoferrales bacterium]|nr:COX15/CtaA family protein [Candidatus Acidoferrales bacterium]